VNLTTKDVRTEWFSGTGAGGQHRNKHQNSCRLVHEPTGVTATAQCRKRDQSFAEAWGRLENKLQRQMDENTVNSAAALRSEMIGTGMRADKIRTYRFQDDQVRDHVTGKSAKCSHVMRGRFNLLH